jgi:biopolymer transport protein ExbB
MQTLEEALAIWQSGGWAMILLAVNAFILFYIGLSVKVKLSERQSGRISSSRYRAWIQNPEQGSGPLGDLIAAALHAPGLQHLGTVFEEFRRAELRLCDRELGIMRVCVSAAPLLGLLGTVTGMLSTFYALAVGTGGEKTMDMVASGISEALITTETGLIIAFPGLIFLHHLERSQEGYSAFVSHLETRCAQAFHQRRTRESGRQQAPLPVPATRSAVPMRETPVCHPQGAAAQ